MRCQGQGDFVRTVRSDIDVIMLARSVAKERAKEPDRDIQVRSELDTNVRVGPRGWSCRRLGVHDQRELSQVGRRVEVDHAESQFLEPNWRALAHVSRTEDKDG